MNDIAKDEEYMAEVLTIASAALHFGELPIASLVVADSGIIASASTSELRSKRFLVHAELSALETADAFGLSLEERRRATLYTNLEPCLMCIGACMSFFLGRVVYGLESPADGGVKVAQSWRRKEEDFPGYRMPSVEGGILRDESIAIFRQYVESMGQGPMVRWAKSLALL